MMTPALRARLVSIGHAIATTGRTPTGLLPRYPAASLVTIATILATLEALEASGG